MSQPVQNNLLHMQKVGEEVMQGWSHKIWSTQVEAQLKICVKSKFIEKKAQLTSLVTRPLGGDPPQVGVATSLTN